MALRARDAARRAQRPKLQHRGVLAGRLAIRVRVAQYRGVLAGRLAFGGFLAHHWGVRGHDVEGPTGVACIIIGWRAARANGGAVFGAAAPLVRGVVCRDVPGPLRAVGCFEGSAGIQ